MQRNLAKETSRKVLALSRAVRKKQNSHAILWALWTAVVVGTAYISWHVDEVAQRPFNALGMAVHCAVVGVIGLVVLTIVEIRLEPWRFMN
jgi:hypothetical protein